MKTILFVPATRLDRVHKAIATGADAVVIDLEDAVGVHEKIQTREALTTFLREQPDVNIWVRVNGASSPWFEQDLLLCQAFTQIEAIMLPKAECADQVEKLSPLGKPIYPIIETAKGIANLSAIAMVKGVAHLSFGALDLSVDLGLERASEGANTLLNHLRTQMVINSKVAGIGAPIESVYPDIHDEAGFIKALTFAKGMGFAGILCIHPKQVQCCQRIHRTSEDEYRWAQGVLAKFEETGLATFAFEGMMVDLPVIEMAKQILHRGK